MNDDIHTLAGAYAVNALPPEEERFFEAHLDACEPCRREVAELRATAATLGAVAAERPRPTLRDDVLAAIDVTRQEPAPTRWVSQSRRRTALTALAAAVAVVAALGVGLAASQLQTQIRKLEATNAQLAAVLADPEAETIDIPGEGSASHGRLVVSRRLGRTVLVADDLPEVGDDEVLEAWLIDDTGAQPAGLFRPDPAGRAVHVVEHDLSGISAVGVTIEPDGGSEQPTTEPFLLADV